MLGLLILPMTLSAQTVIESSMDWTTGIFRITASRPLEPGKSPDDHPRAIEDLEKDLIPLAVNELGQLAWDNRGSLDQLMFRSPESRTAVESLAQALEREWSRLSDDYMFVEAAYVVDLSTEITSAFPLSALQRFPARPPGWRPVPADDWTGIVIYVPDGLPVRGAGMNADARPALRARILTDGLEVLAEPAASGSGILNYLELDERDEAEPMVGRRPFRTMARGLYGDNPCDIIISGDDGADILSSESGRKALEEGRIVVLLDNLDD